MALRGNRVSWPVVGLMVLAIGWWVIDQPGSARRSERIVDSHPERIEGCKWVAHARNDGDSFRLRLPDGRVEEFRLYFADAPESAFRNYGGGRSNRSRIEDQARVMGITPEQAVAVGKAAKLRVEKELSGKSVTIFTEWDHPFGDQRYHAFVERPGGGWLHELLIKEGLARLHTRGAAVPGGPSEAEQARRLKKFEASARGGFP